MNYKNYIVSASILLIGLVLGVFLTKILFTADKPEINKSVEPTKNIVQPVKTKTKEFDFWRLECEANDKNCKIFQLLTFNQKRADETVQTSLALNVIIYITKNEKNETQPRIRFITPLGLDLTSGLAMRVDENKEFKIPIQACTVEGCVSDFNLGDDVLTNMKKGKDIYIGYRSLNLKPIVLKASLKGITAAYEALQQSNSIK